MPTRLDARCLTAAIFGVAAAPTRHYDGHWRDALASRQVYLMPQYDAATWRQTGWSREISRAKVAPRLPARQSRHEYLTSTGGMLFVVTFQETPTCTLITRRPPTGRLRRASSRRRKFRAAGAAMLARCNAEGSGRHGEGECRRLAESDTGMPRISWLDYRRSPIFASGMTR